MGPKVKLLMRMGTSADHRPGAGGRGSGAAALVLLKWRPTWPSCQSVGFFDTIHFNSSLLAHLIMLLRDRISYRREGKETIIDFSAGRGHRAWESVRRKKSPGKSPRALHASLICKRSVFLPSGLSLHCCRTVGTGI